MMQHTPADTLVAGSSMFRERYDNEGNFVEHSRHLIERVGVDSDGKIVVKSKDRVFTFRANDLVLVVAG